jgi:hypothetical protein
MIQIPLHFEKDLEYIFKEEISVYKSILLLESNKKDIILNSKSKDLESVTKQIGHLLNIASEIELRRQKAMNSFFQEEKLQSKNSDIVLSEFLEVLEPVAKEKFIKLAEELRNVVIELREKVLINQNLLKAKQEIFQITMETLKEFAQENTPNVSYDNSNKSTRTRTSIMLNTKA